MSGFRKTGIHPLNPGCIHDRVTASSSVTVDSETPEVPSSVTSPRDTSGSANSLETQCHADSSQSISSVPKSPTSLLSNTMDKLLRKPKLTCKTWRQGRSHNSQAVCITDDKFVSKLKDDNEKQQKDDNKQQKKSPRNRPCTQKTLNVDTKKPRCKQKKKKDQKRKPLSRRELRTRKSDKESENDILGSECESQSNCGCPVCREHFGDRSAIWIQCNECEE